MTRDYIVRSKINNIGNKIHNLEDKIEEVQKENNKIEKELKDIQEQNSEKVHLLELWQKELEKVKNY